MELVTIAEVELFRPESASGRGMTSSNYKSGTFVVGDSNVETLRQQVIDFAEQCGIDRHALDKLQQVSSFNYTHERGVIVFDIASANVHYSQPYAACNATPALKVGQRFFKLAEVFGVSTG